MITLTCLCLLGLHLTYGHLFPFSSNNPSNQLATSQIPITCYSYGRSPNQCVAPGRIVEASLVRQTFGTGAGNCRIYNTFGFVGNYLWVKDGCGGQFNVRYANEINRNFINQQTFPRPGVYPNSIAQMNQGTGNCPTYNTQLQCVSVNNAYNRCSLDYKIVRVDVSQPYSSAPCRYGSGFGRTTTGKIWVSNGCSAKFDVTFRICSESGSSDCQVSSTVVDCLAKRAGAFTDVTECELPFHVTNVQILQRSQLTAFRCNMPGTYGQTFNGIWVNKGCRGTFDVQFQICAGR